MENWEIEAIDLLNQRIFQITDPGPLHAPITSFSLSRNEDLTIILETLLATTARSTAPPSLSGTVRFSIEEVKIVGPGDTRAVLGGVQSTSVSGSLSLSQHEILKERAHVHQVFITFNRSEEAAYTIEWLENVPCRPFIWPDVIRSTTETTVTHVIANLEDGLTIADSSSGSGSSRSAAKLTVGGQTLYLCAKSEGRSAGIKRGCIIYVGTPDDLVKKKIRNALSFALGFYIVEMGHTVFDREWRVLTATSRSAYSLAKRTFDAVPMPLAYLSDRNFQHDLGRAELGRMVNALVESYEQLDLGNLAWAYWHAGTATVHIAPAHFGAAIEALQGAYCKSHPNMGRTKILSTGQWKELREHLARTIESAQIDQDCKNMLKEKLSDLNRPTQRVILKSVLEQIDLELGAAENDAWKRRNDAAHGTPIPEGEELSAIKDMHLLRALFSRMLLRMSNSAEYYVDYATPGFPIRPLREPAASN